MQTFLQSEFWPTMGNLGVNLGGFSSWAKWTHKVFGRDIPGTSGTQTSGHPGQNLCKWPFSVVLDREWPGCPGIWVGRPGF